MNPLRRLKRVRRLLNLIIFLLVVTIGVLSYLYFMGPECNCPMPLEIAVTRKDSCVDHYWTRDYELDGSGTIIAVGRYIGTDYDKAKEMLGTTEYLNVVRNCQ